MSRFWSIINKNRDNSSQEIVSKENLVTVNNVSGKTRNIVVMQTASLEEKILPTTKLILEKKYQDCKHTISKEVELPEEMVNLTRKELSELYSDWTIKDFSKNKVVLYRLANGLCDEHFLINDENGVVVVYRLDEDYNKSLYEKTDIYTEYLPLQDIERLKEGIYVYTVSDLNSELENLE